MLDLGEEYRKHTIKVSEEYQKHGSVAYDEAVKHYIEACTAMELCSIKAKPIVSNTVMTKYIVGFANMKELEDKLPKVRLLLQMMGLYVNTVDKWLKEACISYDRNGLEFTLTNIPESISKVQAEGMLYKEWKQAIEKLLSELNMDINPYEPFPTKIEINQDEDTGL